MEGASVAHAHGIRLVRLALKRAHYPLVAELLRFIVFPGELDAAAGGWRAGWSGYVCVAGGACVRVCVGVGVWVWVWPEVHV